MTGGKVNPVEIDIPHRPSTASSIFSLTPSQLNSTIMDMLNMRQAATRCDAVCRGKQVLDLYKPCKVRHIILIG